MAFDPAALSPADQQAFQAWQQQVQDLIRQSGGGIPAPVSYAMQHPEYLTSHPEIQAQTDLLMGRTLPPSIQGQIANSHLDTGGGAPTFAENKGFWSHPESWLQLAFGIGLGGVAAAGLAGGAGAGAGASSGGAGAAGTAGAAGAAGTGASVAGTGSILGTAGTIAKIGQAATALASGNVAGKLQQTGVNQSTDRLALQRYQDELDAARLNLGAPQVRARQSVAGDVLANAQPYQFTGGTHMVGNIPVPTHTGGLSPALFSPNTRALGGQLSSQALADNTAMGGKAIGAPPALTPNPNIGTAGTLLNTAGIIGGLAPLFGDLYKKYQSRGNTASNPLDDWTNVNG